MPRHPLCEWTVADLAMLEPEAWQVPPLPFQVHEGAVGAYRDKRSGHWYVKYTGGPRDERVQVKHGTFSDERVAWAIARWLATQSRATVLSAGHKGDAFRRNHLLDGTGAPPTATAPRKHCLPDDDEHESVKRMRCIPASDDLGRSVLADVLD